MSLHPPTGFLMRPTAPRALRLLLFVIALSPTSFNDALAQWSWLSQQDHLRGKAIVDVGEVSRQLHITPGSYEYDPVWDTRRWKPGRTVDYVQFRGLRTICLDPAATSTSSNEAALLLMDSDDRVYLAVLTSSLGSINVKVSAVLVIECPFLF